MLEFIAPSPTFPATSFTRSWKWWSLRLAVGLLTGMALATAYGWWLSTDSVKVEMPVDAVVIFGGFNRHELGASWTRTGQCREIWLLSSPPTAFEKLGIARPGADISRERLIKLGVAPSAIRVFSVHHKENDPPGALRSLAEVLQRQSANRIMVTCQSLEVRFLRQVANGAISTDSSQRMQFFALPSDRYASPFWWLSRTGLKDVWNQSLQIFSNWWDGPTNGFGETDWNPETWEPPRLETSL